MRAINVYAKSDGALTRSCLCGHAESAHLGWAGDQSIRFNPWVLYVDLPQGQVSFHSPTRYTGPDYPGQWDGQHRCEERILAFCDSVFKREAVAA